MSGFPSTTQPTPILKAFHAKRYAWVLIGSDYYVEYEGFNRPGALDSDKGWIIKKYTYDANANVTGELFANGTDIPASLTWTGYDGYDYS